MPQYEYRCEGCGEQFVVVQPVYFRAEDTTCPSCQAQKATRLLSTFASKVVGDQKPGFSEMKAYSMLNERMDKFKRLPPIIGKRANPTPNVTEPSGSGSTEAGGTGPS